MEKIIKEKKLTLDTAAGCRKLLVISIVIILLFSCLARVISSDFGTVKITRIAIDARGATIDAELYYPYGTKGDDSLPGIIVTHGIGCTLGVTKGIAQELARRGFVVMNVSGYGTGGSEYPFPEEDNNSPDSGGIYDALNYLRSLTFVDQERIGMIGHSMGSGRVANAAAIDCGYLTYNDIMVNVLYNVFGQKFTEAEINENADVLAASRLNEDQLAYYNELKDINRHDYDSKVKSVCILGGAATIIATLNTVEVAGYEVQRNAQVNIGFVLGEYDFPMNTAYPTNPKTLEACYTDVELTREQWYAVDDATKKSEQLGNIFEVSVTSSSALKNAIDDRSTRIVIFNPETHSENFFSSATAADVVKYFEQTLGYNRGELSSTSTTPLDSGNILFIWREVFNCIAMFAMLAMLIPIAGLFLKTRFFAPCKTEGVSDISTSFSKKKYWVVAAFAAVFGFIAIYVTNSLFAPGLPALTFLPLFSSWWLTLVYLGIVAGGAILILTVLWLIGRKDKKPFNLKTLIKMNPIAVLKTVLISVILLALAYLSLTLIGYLFGEDYRLWMTIFTYMKVEYWGLIWRFAIILTPCLLVVGALVNYTIRKDIPEWLDTLITVAINSLGVWALYLINELILNSSGVTFSNWTSSYGMLLLVPITVYITRKMYKVSKSIWLGAFVMALLLSWSMVSSMGYNSSVTQTFLSSFFNF